MSEFLQFLTNSAIVSLVAGYLFALYSTHGIPKKIIEIVSLYLVFAIGYKGGACLTVGGQCSPMLFVLAGVGVAIGFLQPFLYHYILKKTTRLDSSTMAVLACQYGSISIVTFITALKFLAQKCVAYDSYMTAIAGLMEIPALFSGLFLLNNTKQQSEQRSLLHSVVKITTAIITCRKINLIFIGFFVGFISSYYSTGLLDACVITPFNAMLVLFMIDIGIKIARQREHIKTFSVPLILFGMYVPLVSGIAAVFVAHLLSVSVGSSLLFAVLIASASYIAVPAIMQSEARGAKQVVYMPMALGITLPFNILIGIPLYFYCATFLSFL